MKKLVLIITLPLAMIAAADQPSAKRDKQSQKSKEATQGSSVPASKVIIPPGFGPQVNPGAAPSKKTAKPHQAPPAAAARPDLPVAPPNSDKPTVEIPAGATEIAPNVFKHTDASGKSWLYRKTPLGVTKVDESQSPNAATADPTPQGNPQEGVRSNKSPFGESKVQGSAAPGQAPEDPSLKLRVVKDFGDRVQFERPSPFGATRWERNKSEMTEAERAALERDQKKSGSSVRQ
jgi:hypothetical protein